MSLIGKIQTIFSDAAKTKPIYPRTKIGAVSDENGTRLDFILANEQARWAGGWIEFTDENGNPTDEPYFHYAVDENGNPVYNSEISLAEDGEF